MTKKMKRNFRQHIYFSLLWACLLPCMLLGTFTLYQTYQNAQTHKKEIVETNLKQISQNMERQVDAVVNSMNLLIGNTNLKTFLTTEYASPYEEYIAKRDLLLPTLQNVRVNNLLIERIYLFSDGQLKEPTSTMIQTIPSFTHLEKKAEKYHSFYWFAKKNEIYLIGKILHQSTLNYYCAIQLSYHEFFDTIPTNLAKTCNVVIQNKKGEHIYEVSHFPKKQETAAISQNISRLPWRVFFTFNRLELKKKIMPTLFVTFFILLFALFISFVFSSFLSKRILRFINQLKNKVNQVYKKDYTVSFETNPTDELGELSQLIGKMVVRGERLLKRMYEVKLQQQASEYEALTNQINSHFLYNTLSLISWKAIMNNQPEISDITQSLSKFYRTTLNKGKSEMALKDELENAKAYIRIQQFLNPGRLNVYYHLDPTLTNQKVINLLLQPIIENAIEHGFANKSYGCILIIKTKKEKNRLVITIGDNGIGMTSYKKNEIVKTNKQGYGLKNIEKRIRFYFGKQYGLQIKSQLNVGTVVKIYLPLDQVKYTNAAKRNA